MFPNSTDSCVGGEDNAGALTGVHPLDFGFVHLRSLS